MKRKRGGAEVGRGLPGCCVRAAVLVSARFNSAVRKVVDSFFPFFLLGEHSEYAHVETRDWHAVWSIGAREGDVSWPLPTNENTWGGNNLGGEDAKRFVGDEEFEEKVGVYFDEEIVSNDGKFKMF